MNRPIDSSPERTDAACVEVEFSTLLYRYVFFDWLFADFGKACDLFERRAVWQHNRAMRRYLPVYLRRWSVIAVMAFSLGCLFEQLLETSVVAACFFTGCAMTMTGMAQICVLWFLLARPERTRIGGIGASGETMGGRAANRFDPPDERRDPLCLQW